MATGAMRCLFSWCVQAAEMTGRPPSDRDMTSVDDVEPVGPTVPGGQLQRTIDVLFGVGKVAALQEPVDLLPGNGLGKEEALGQSAFRVSQGLQLVRMLDALGNHLKAEGLAQLNE